MTILFYASASILLFFSYLKDKKKTISAIKKAWKSFENIMPQFLGIIFIVGLMLSVLSPEAISNMIGSNSGFIGVFISALVGSVTMMPTFVAFSTADTLLKSGAGYAQVAALVSTLTLVGVITFNLEAQYIGKKAAFFRNLYAFLFSLLVAVVIGKVVPVV